MNTVRLTSKINGLTASAHQIRLGHWVTWDNKQSVFLSTKSVIPYLCEKIKAAQKEYYVSKRKRTK